MLIKFTKHALERMRLRNISKEEIINAIENPDQILNKIQKPKKMLEMPQDSNPITNKILNVLSDKWQNFQRFANRLNLSDKTDVKYLQLKLKELERKRIIKMDVFDNVKHWKIS